MTKPDARVLAETVKKEFEEEVSWRETLPMSPETDILLAAPALAEAVLELDSELRKERKRVERLEGVLRVYADRSSWHNGSWNRLGQTGWAMADAALSSEATGKETG